MNPRELRAQRAKLVQQAREILDRAEAEKRNLTAEEELNWNKMHDEIDRLTKQIEREERQILVDALESPRPAANMEDAAGKPQDQVREAFVSWLRYGTAGLTPEQRDIMQARFTPLDQRALGVSVPAAGGYTVPVEMYARLVEAQKPWVGVRLSRAEVITTDSGVDIPIPTADDTGNKGVRVSENTAITEQDTTFGQKLLKAYMYTSRIVRVSIQLLQDSAFDIEAYLIRALSERIGRALNEDLTLGTGVDQPQGVVTGALEGKVGAAGQTNSVTYEDLVDLIHSVNPAYRANAEWMFHDNTLRALKKMKDSQGRPLWVPGLAEREPDTLLGYRYVVNNDMPEMAAGAKSILFGDFLLYKIRDVRQVVLLRLQERYAEYLQVGFIAYARHGGVLADAGQGPIRYYQNAAS